MQVLQMARQAGKTTKAVELAVEKGYDILVYSQNEKQRLLTTFPKLDKDQVFTTYDLLAGNRRGFHKYGATVIDNAELVLGQMVPNAKLMTITDYTKEEK